MTDRRGLVAVVALVACAVTACGSSGSPGAPQKESLKVDWVTTNDAPGCTYDAGTKTVTAQLSLDGFAPKKKTVSLVVTAYADENTSVPVGSKSSLVTLDGTFHKLLTVTFVTARPPQIGEDDVAACGRVIKD